MHACPVLSAKFRPLALNGEDAHHDGSHIAAGIPRVRETALLGLHVRWNVAYCRVAFASAYTGSGLAIWPVIGRCRDLPL